MPELTPYPLSGLVKRALTELDRTGTIFDLPRHRFHFADPGLDTSVTVHGRRVEAPLGPSAGPHTQMAQNIALGWLGGARVFELKTVQRNDRLTIPRPCIEVRGTALNVEWSQELTLDQSLEEYVKASMLVEILARRFDVPPGCLFDMSVGYDYAGITSEPMIRFMRGLVDATTIVEGLRGELPLPWNSMDFNPSIATSVTLSTFHGCPVGEIEQMADFLMTGIGLDCSIKLNPTLLGRHALLEILHDRLGYRSLHVPSDAFDKDPSWDDAVGIVERLQRRARTLGRSFGIKLTNTLVVENRSSFLPSSEPRAYLSGPPLHVLAVHLVQRFRSRFGNSLPISFSAGVDRRNYPDLVALGLAPITVCTDLLKSGGYSRLHGYAGELTRRMRDHGAASIDAFAHASIDDYVRAVDADPHYRMDHVEKTARRERPRRLDLFDCSNCDLCISSCPNDANMRLPSLDCSIPFARPHQIATFADFCNDCGVCEMVCPDGGAPNRIKMRFFGSEDSWRAHAPRDGFWVGPEITRARIDGAEYQSASSHPLVGYARRAALHRSRANFINTLITEDA